MEPLAVGQIFRTAGDYDPAPAFVDGLPNFWHHTLSADGTRAVMMAGINPLRGVEAVDGQRTPAILIRSTPHKAGTSGTPWQDHFDTDNGHIRYFGDNKVDDDGERAAFDDPAKAPGNAALLIALPHHQAHTREDRERAIPVLFFRTPASGRVVFEGFGIVESAAIVAQRDQRSGRTFSNFVYDFLALDLSAEGERFPWSWIEARRDPTQSGSASSKEAPDSWKEFVREGLGAAPRIRRRVSRMLSSPTEDQSPPPAARKIRP